MLAAHVAERRAALAPRQIANATWACARLQSTGLLPRVSAVASQQQQQQQQHGIGVTVHTCALLPWLANAAGHMWDALAPQELSSMLYSLAAAGQLPPSATWLTGCVQAVHLALPRMSPQAVANTLWALSHWARWQRTSVASDAAGGGWLVRAVQGEHHVGSAAMCPAPAPLAGSLQRLMQAVWEITATQMCAVAADGVGSVGGGGGGAARHDNVVSSSSWPPASLAIIAWSQASMRVSSSGTVWLCVDAWLVRCVCVCCVSVAKDLLGSMKPRIEC